MQPVAFERLSGGYNQGEVTLSWKYPAGAPDTVYIYPVTGTGASRRVEPAKRREFPLYNASSGARFEFDAKSAYDVTCCQFLVFLAEGGNSSLNPGKLIDDPAFSVSITVGSAAVFFDIKTKRLENGFESHVVRLQSGHSLEQGILGYSFMYGGRRFRAAFPGEIRRGKSKYPAFCTREGGGVRVEVVSGANTDVMAIPKKMSASPFA